MTSVIHVEPPKSIDLTHLSRRAKKQQIIDLRNNEIATENKKLMSKMTQVGC